MPDPGRCIRVADESRRSSWLTLIGPKETFPYILSLGIAIQGIVFAAAQSLGLGAVLTLGCTQTSRMMLPGTSGKEQPLRQGTDRDPQLSSSCRTFSSPLGWRRLSEPWRASRFPGVLDGLSRSASGPSPSAWLPPTPLPEPRSRPTFASRNFCGWCSDGPRAPLRFSLSSPPSCSSVAYLFAFGCTGLRASPRRRGPWRHGRRATCCSQLSPR